MPLNKSISIYFLNGLNVTDFINRIVQILRGDLYWVKISAQEAKLIKPVEPWDEG